MQLRTKTTLSIILLLIATTVESVAFAKIILPASNLSRESKLSPLRESASPSSQEPPFAPSPIDIQTVIGKSLAAEEALTMAKEAFAQNYTDPVLQCSVFRHYENTSKFWVSIYYAIIFNYSEGQFTIPYRHDYIVNTETRTIDHGPIIDLPQGFVAKFVGKDGVTSKHQAIQAYFMLLDKSPSENYYIYSIENDLLNLETMKRDDTYCVVGTFKNYAVNCINARITISYNIFQNGTAILESAIENVTT